ncbi:hypothetical protein RUM44_011498 [Polyplax serrata]|uniref:Uncharacterized protein n=1 Tax=Polyplax serrata TaxID=468196 RepID=A0ABR1AQA1_POLSC
MYLPFFVLTLFCCVQVGNAEYKQIIDNGGYVASGEYYYDYRDGQYDYPHKKVSPKTDSFKVVGRDKSSLRKLEKEIKDMEELLVKRKDLSSQLEQQIFGQERNLKELRNTHTTDDKKEKAIRVLKDNLDTLKKLLDGYYSQIKELKTDLERKRRELYNLKQVEEEIVLRQNPKTEADNSGTTNVQKANPRPTKTQQINSQPNLINLLGSALTNKISAFFGLLDGVRNVTSDFIYKLSSDPDVMKVQNLMNLPAQIRSGVLIPPFLKTNNVLKKLASLLD